MQPDVRFLNGTWEGTSVPFRRDRESTKWVEVDLTFDSTSVTGSGISQWGGQNIPFRITGKFDPATGTFEITKKHEGKFVNSLVFRGRIDFTRRELRGQYRSGNLCIFQVSTRQRAPDSKRITIRTTEPTGQPLARLSGAWDGEYISRKKGEITTWRNCAMEFTLQTGQGQVGKIDGQGESLWRGEVIPFKLSGTFDLKQLWVDLLKTHQGKWTNTAQYRLSLDLKQVQMTGEDGSGSLTLKKFGHCSSASPSALSFIKTPPLGGPSPSGALSPSMPGLETYRRAQTISPPVGGSSSRSLSPASKSHRLPSPTKTLTEHEAPVDYTEIDPSSLEATRLKLGKLTIESEKDSPTSPGPMTVIGNTPAQEKFMCYLDGLIMSTPSSTIPLSTSQEKHVTKDMYILSAKQSQAVTEFRLKYKISDDDNKLVLSQLKIVDCYAPPPIVTKTLSPTYMYDNPISTTTQQQQQKGGYGPFMPRDEETAPLPIRSSLPVVSTGRLVSGSSRGSIESSGGYGSIGGSSPSYESDSGTDPSSVYESPQPSNYGAEIPREAYAFFEPESEVVKDSSPPTSPTVEEESENLCKVCFDAKMNCVLVPCGHYSICMKCAKLLASCPVCRCKIEQRQLVFRS